VIDAGLSGQVVLVTGGSRGIGEAISRAFAAQGSQVAIHYHPSGEEPPPGTRWEHITPPASAAAALARELPAAVTVAADLAAPDAAARLLNAVEDQLGRVDVLVNNAAHCESPDTIDTLTADSLQRHFQINAIAPSLLTAEFARRAHGRPALCVVNISTDAARCFAGQIGYGTSKAALEAFTRAAALDLAASGIRVNTVAPGPIQTGWISDSDIGRVGAMIPLGRVGEPGDIADAVVFLASHQARWITGQTLQVAGGHAL